MSTFYAPTSDLYHYGVIGMKWGVRKRSGYTRKDIRSDNKKAFELGKKATILDAASRYGMEIHNKKLRKLEKEMAKDPTSKKVEKLKKESDLHSKVRKKLDLDRDYAVADMYKHRAELVSKYGEEHVSKFKHEKAGDSIIKERVTSKGERAMDAAMVLMAPLPVRVVYGALNPRSRKDRAVFEYAARMNKKAVSKRRVGITTANAVRSNHNAFTQQAIREANRTASLGITGGVNPFIFG